MSYQAPVKDMLFNIQHLAGLETLTQQIPAFADFGLDTAGAVLDAITVQVRDALGNAVTSYAGPVTLTLSSGVVAAESAQAAPFAGDSAQALMTGPITVTAVAGVATFPNVQIGPMGPWLVTADACDGTNTQVRCWVNGEERQNASTRDLIFDIPTLIETLSAGITLYPGDVIATGTPVGVGIGFKPPRYLQAGDVVRVEIDGIGALENPVR